MKLRLPSLLTLAALLATEACPAAAAPAPVVPAPATMTYPGTVVATSSAGWGKIKRKKRRRAAYQRLRKRHR
ncbi:hypothetical protein KLP40_07680 [Hymenobacter sp. NST-14]|uniref:hypothetical protein n=1 Tax=Hymenobacter piscis TaxID=2839984 RepID=UPI001C033AF7|nr:hypothetical protein [Hymenobacter piscis]MBT9393039.1 hypothetical protein [Hymenobacter piscis]